MLHEHWHKSSYSQGGNSNCLEARLSDPTTIDLRDTQHPHHAVLTVDCTEWAAFLKAATQGEL